MDLGDVKDDVKKLFPFYALCQTKQVRHWGSIGSHLKARFPFSPYRPSNLDIGYSDINLDVNYAEDLSCDTWLVLAALIETSFRRRVKQNY